MRALFTRILIITGLVLLNWGGGISLLEAQVKVSKVIPLPDKKMVPEILRADKDKNLWIYNSKKKTLQQISEKGLITKTIPAQKKGQTLYKSLQDFFFTQEGNLIIVDEGLSKIVLLKSRPRKKDSELWDDIEIETLLTIPKPLAAAISHDDIMAIGNEKSMSVQIYSLDGILLHQLFAPEPNEFKSLTQISFSRNGVLWALDGKRGKLHRFSAARRWLGQTPGLAGAKDMVLDEYGFAYVLLEKGKWVEINHEGKIIQTFGTKGKDVGMMKKPSSLALQNASLLWVADKGNRRLQLYEIFNEDKILPLIEEPTSRIQIRKSHTFSKPLRDGVIFNSGEFLLLHTKKSFLEWVSKEGKSKQKFRNKGKREKGLSFPVDMALDSAENIWILDSGDHLIKQMDRNGKILSTVGKKGRKDGYIKNPNFLNVRLDDSYVLVDKNQSRLQTLSKDGLFLFSLHKGENAKGQFKEISGLTTTTDKIALIDNERKAFLLFDTNGKFIKEIANRPDKAPVWGTLAGITSDKEGRFYILDTSFSRVRIFTAEGRFIGDFSTAGKKIISGPNYEVFVMGEKTSQLFHVYPVPKATQQLLVKENQGNLDLVWDPNAQAEKFNLYRTSEPPHFDRLHQTTHTTYTDTTTTPGINYTYAVRGENALGYEGNWAFSETIRGPKKRDVSLVSIEIIDFEPIFTAAYKYYVDTPIGEIQIRNNNAQPYRDVKIGLTLKRYTDYATEITVDRLEAGELKTVPVTMTFNDKVLEITEETPAQVDIRLTFFEDNEEKQISKNAPLNLFSRNAISWKDKARISSFITPKDPPVVEFSRKGIKAFLPELKGSTVGKPLAKTALFYDVMNALEISYVQDPITPYELASQDPELLDYVQFPRETLRRKTGDCDDTSALLAALLESIGVETTFVDTPGHIFMMANLEETDPLIIGFPAEKFIEYRGTLWVPVETTKLGHSFKEAWQAGLVKINQAKEKNQLDFVPFSVAREIYPPVTLVQKAEDQPDFPLENLKTVYPKTIKELQNEKYEHQLAFVKKELLKDPSNSMLEIKLGMVHIEGGKTDKAHGIFKKLTEDDAAEVQSAAHNNLGNMAYLNGKFKEAAQEYEDAAILSPDDGGIAVNRARTAWKLGQKSNTKKHLKEARPFLTDWKEYAKDIPRELWPK